MKKFLAVSLFLLSAFCFLPSALLGQAGGVTQPIVASKYSYTAVQKTATGNLWTAAQPSLNYQNAIVHWVTAGSPSSCTLHILTGPTIALATLPIDDPNYAITCTASGEHVVGALNNYFQINLYAFDVNTGHSVTVYVTLTNFAGNALNQTVSTVTQGAGAASPGAYPWYLQESDGTNKGPVGDASARSKYVIVNDGSSHNMPAADASARSIYVIPNDGSSHNSPAGDASARSIYVVPNDGSSHNLPAGDAQARAVNVIPGNGTNAFKDVLAGVGALGAGVQQVAEIGTLSSAASTAGTALQVAAGPGSGSTVLLGVFVETATNATGSVVVEWGTGTNCASTQGTIVTLGPATATSPLGVGYYPIHALLPAQAELCLITDATTTSARALTQ